MWKTATCADSRRSRDASLHATLSLSPCHTPSQLDLDFPAPELEEPLSRLNAVSQKNDLHKEIHTASPVLRNEEGTRSGRECWEGLFKQEGVVSEVQGVHASAACVLQNGKWAAQSGRAPEGLLVRQEGMFSDVQAGYMHRGGQQVHGKLSPDECVLWNGRERAKSDQDREAGMFTNTQETIVSEAQGSVHCAGREEKPSAECCVPAWNEEQVQRDRETEGMSEAQGFVHCEEVEKDLYIQEQQEWLPEEDPLDTQRASHHFDSPYGWRFVQDRIRMVRHNEWLDIPATRPNIRPTDVESEEDMLSEKSPTEKDIWSRARPTLFAALSPPNPAAPVSLSPGPSSLPEFDKQAQDKEALDEVLDLDTDSQDDLSDDRSDSSWSVISSPALPDMDYKRPREKVDKETVCAGAKMKVDNCTEHRASQRVASQRSYVTDTSVTEEEVKVEQPPLWDAATDGKAGRKKADNTAMPSLENSLYCRERAESLLTPQFVQHPNTPFAQRSSHHGGQTAVTEQNKTAQCSTQPERLQDTLNKVPITPCAQGSPVRQTDAANENTAYGESYTHNAGPKTLLSSESKGTTNEKDNSCVCIETNRRTSTDIIASMALKQDILRLERRVGELESTNIYQALIIRILTQL